VSGKKLRGRLTSEKKKYWFPSTDRCLGGGGGEKNRSAEGPRRPLQTGRG